MVTTPKIELVDSLAKKYMKLVSYSLEILTTCIVSVRDVLGEVSGL